MMAEYFETSRTHLRISTEKSSKNKDWGNATWCSKTSICIVKSQYYLPKNLIVRALSKRFVAAPGTLWVIVLNMK